LQSLAASHDVLIQEDWRGAPIRALVERQLDFVRPEPSALHVEGPALLLSATACQNFGLGLHELATNAVKHGALSVPGGKVNVRWRVNNESEPWFQFEWVERGGPSVRASSRKGFGFVILKEVVPTALGGTAMLDMAPDGIRWSLKAPLDRVVAVDGE
jgi:two-component sensor histidine kinase